MTHIKTCSRKKYCDLFKTCDSLTVNPLLGSPLPNKPPPSLQGKKVNKPPSLLSPPSLPLIVLHQ